MCCAGCQAVAQAIVAAGLVDYYRHREAPVGGAAAVPPEIESLAIFDEPDVQAGFVRQAGGGDSVDCAQASLAIEGMRCGACVWLLERALAGEPGVVRANVNFATERAVLTWDPARTRLSRLLERIRAVGYRALPFDPRRREAQIAETGRLFVKRLFVAGIGMMQVMMYALPGYTTQPGEIDLPYERLMRWASLVLTIPVVLYSARPFFAGAWRDLRARSPGMDVPVALGIGAAFAASVHATLAGRGEVYFDSVTMFVFLLLGARHLEWVARRRAGRALDVIATAAPEQVTRLVAGTDGAPVREERVPAIRIAAGERFRVDGGERIAVDGRVTSGRGAIDRSLLTGESVPVTVVAGDIVPGGAVNAGAPLVLEAVASAASSTLSTIERLIERSALDKPRIAQLADRVAAVFVAVLLAFAALVFAAWWAIAPERALPIAIAVLVVSCPCALSLATPAALAAATGALLRRHVLITRGDALEAMAAATDVVFDKTGTLTRGQPVVIAIQIAEPSMRDTALQWAALLEAGSPHPFAAAIRAAAAAAAVPELEWQARDRHDEPGFGVAATLVRRDGTGPVEVALGSAPWCTLDEAQAQRLRECAADDALTPPATIDPRQASEVFLVVRDDGRPPRPIARFALADPPRAEAGRVVTRLQTAGLRIHLLSGDRAAAVGEVAAALGIATWRAGASPDDKLAYVQALQGAGRSVVMVGDGVNDAPVLAAADVSVAVGQASTLARTAADAIVLAPTLDAVADLVDTARDALRVVRQNLAWAALYNAVAIPAAALGWVPPWLAAIGMAASSLLVAGNALRLWAWKRSSS